MKVRFSSATARTLRQERHLQAILVPNGTNWTTACGSLTVEKVRDEHGAALASHPIAAYKPTEQGQCIVVSMITLFQHK